MLDFFTSFLPAVPGWITALTGVLGLGSIGLLWFFGLMPIVTAALAPIVSAVVNGVLWLIETLWLNIFWPGIRDICKEWVMIITVVSMCVAIWFGAIASHKVEVRSLNFEINQCRVELNKVHKELPVVDKPTWDLPWPWKW